MPTPRARFARLAAPLALGTCLAVAAGGSIQAAAPTPVTLSTLAAERPEPFSTSAGELSDVDDRGPALRPTSAQRAASRPLDAAVTWNANGTPSTVLDVSGEILGTRTGDNEQTARDWLEGHAALFGLDADQLADLELVSDQALADTSKTVGAVLFRQTFDGLPSAVDGQVAVGVGPRGVEFVSSSLLRTDQDAQQALPAPELGATAAWSAAAEDADMDALLEGSLAEISRQGLAKQGWTVFRAPGLSEPQQVRERALVRRDGSVLRVYEVNVVDNTNAVARAYTSYVDASTGEVLIRHDQVDEGLAMAESSTPFTGTVNGTTCSTAGPFPVDAATKTITVVANAANIANDMVLKLVHGGSVVASQDTATSPEVIAYSPEAGVPAGDYTVEVCPFEGTAWLPPTDYYGTFTTSDLAANPPEAPGPAWRVFMANPVLNFAADVVSGGRVLACWMQQDRPACSEQVGSLASLAARYPWDVNPQTGTTTTTTDGNAATTAEAWGSPLTPGGSQRPVHPDRLYSDTFQDVWNNQQCNPAVLTPGGNDILAAVTNLFAGHNAMHDYSYRLGFTERNYNLQKFNAGAGGAQGDPEIGNAQAGAISGGAPTYLGRDNANQITLQDGVPGITNQYLFQPIAGAFYSPCVDGDLDATVYGHEYTHAISNRMVAGPDQGLTGLHGGSMGESWSDQVALEYLFSHNYSTGTNPWVLGPYVTGNETTGIRNYALHRNPLQYGDIGYDVTGPEVHADGEVWSAIMWEVRQALVRRWNAAYPYADETMQRRCAEAVRSPRECPGNRRWIQLVFDSFLLQQAGTDFVQARDAFVAADRMRFSGNLSNQKVIWDAFARRGLGLGATARGVDDGQPRPSYVSPMSPEGTLRVRALTPAGERVAGELFVSRYSARITPVADTLRASELDDSLRMVPGRYHFTFAAPGHGITGFDAEVRAGQTMTKVLRLSKNLASTESGASVDGRSAGSLNPTFLLDDSENTNWGVNQTGTSVDAEHPFLNVNLAGGAHEVRRVRVSAQLNPAQEGDADQDSGSRFTALRQFAIEVCVQSAGHDCSSAEPAASGPYRRVFTSPADAFAAVRPRPTAPKLLIEAFDIPDVQATHVRIVVLENQCTGTPAYAGEQDQDPLNATDCKAASDRDEFSHVAELQVFG